jgi:hypothetical protein
LNLYDDSFIWILAAIWLAASIIGGAALAFIATRIHRTISFKKNWLFFSVLLGVVTALIFGVAVR